MEVTAGGLQILYLLLAIMPQSTPFWETVQSQILSYWSQNPTDSRTAVSKLLGGHLYIHFTENLITTLSIAAKSAIALTWKSPNALNLSLWH